MLLARRELKKRQNLKMLTVAFLVALAKSPLFVINNFLFSSFVLYVLLIIVFKDIYG